MILYTDPSQSLVFGYNGDDFDEEGFGSNAPVMAMDVMRGPLDENREEIPLTYAVPFTEDSFTDPQQFQNLLNGLNTDGGQGPIGGFSFPGNPNEPDDVSEVTAGNTPGDRKLVSSFSPFLLQPGAINEIVLGFTAYQGTAATIAENIDLMYEKSGEVQGLFDNCFDINFLSDACPATPVSVKEIPAFSMEVYPNPATDWLYIKPDNYLSEINILTIDGKIVVSKTISNRALEQSVNLSELSSGIYLLEARTSDGKEILREKLMVIRE